MTWRMPAIVALVATLGPVALAEAACERQPSPNAQCEVAVDLRNGKAIAVFPVLKPQQTWRWRKSSTRDMAREYEWRVSLGRCGASGTFEVADYGFGASLFKFTGDAERTGSLDDLLRAAQTDVWSREIRGNQVLFTRLSDFRLLAGVSRGDVVIGLTDRKAIDLLFQNRPEVALLEVAALEPEQSYTCTAKIHYEK